MVKDCTVYTKLLKYFSFNGKYLLVLLAVKAEGGAHSTKRHIVSRDGMKLDRQPRYPVVLLHPAVLLRLHVARPTRHGRI